MIIQTKNTQTSLLLVFISIVFTILTFSKAASQTQSLKEQSVVIPKLTEPLSQKTKDFLLQQNKDIVKVWVFYTDKGVFNKSDFTTIASTIQLSEKVLKRRAKVNKDKIVFADLPVVAEYVEQVTNKGCKLRRVSKWLNAASFETPLNLLEEISFLPFVAYIKPVAGFKRIQEEFEILEIEEPDKSRVDLNYGFAQTQLEQINVPAVHNKGYHGEGITLAIFDTGFRKTHEAFAIHYLENRVLAEYDFVFNDGNTANESEDWSSQWNHGTYIWSVTGGFKDGYIYGPAFKANFLLAKTEDIRSETPIEEDNWVAALEWADSLGADVVTSSLGYSDWYNYWDMDGNTATTTLAANTAADLGIILCNSMGNSGPGAITLSAPADAFNILAVGAVNSSGVLASFSSRGPTFDGRTKPEVCAMGVATSCATANSDNSYGAVSGTSLSTPLVAGAAGLIVQARPTFNPYLIRLAMMGAADNADNPNNDYGWGIIDANASLSWGADFEADIEFAQAPFTVQFTDISSLEASSWKWSFGDGDSAFIQNPSHYYGVPGIYNVSLSIETSYGEITNEKAAFIIGLGDTVTFVSDSGFAGRQVVMSVELVNSQSLNRIDIPFRFDDSPRIQFDSAATGERTNYFETLEIILWDPWFDRYGYRLIADNGGGSPLLSPGSGEVLKLFFTIDPYELGGQSYPIDTVTEPVSVKLTSEYLIYDPVIYTGSIMSTFIIRGDVDYSQEIDIEDLVYMVDYSFNNGSEPVTIQSIDVNADLQVDIADIVYMVDFMFHDGPPPPTP